MRNDPDSWLIIWRRIEHVKQQLLHKQNYLAKVDYKQ
jgi:hypothetical protein